MAKFEIAGKDYGCIVDTGATIPFIPEQGDIMRRLKHQSLAANLNVKLAYSFVSHINKKVFATLRPSNSNTRPITASFYVNNNTKDILGCEALIGLKQLKQFNLSIMFINEQVVVYHEDKPIGFQPVSFGYGLA